MSQPEGICDSRYLRAFHDIPTMSLPQRAPAFEQTISKQVNSVATRR